VAKILTTTQVAHYMSLEIKRGDLDSPVGWARFFVATQLFIPQSQYCQTVSWIQPNSMDIFLLLYIDVGSHRANLLGYCKNYASPDCDVQGCISAVGAPYVKMRMTPWLEELRLHGCNR
jgi:hypothetical protein